MIRLCLAALLVALLCPMFAVAADTDAPSVEAPVRAAAPAVDAVSAASDQFFSSGSLSLRERRKLGLTIPKMAAALKDLHKAGELEPDMDKSLVAAMVFEQLAAENMEAYSDAGLDLDAILAFIERFLPLLMTILGLFS